ncbi:sporulation protein YpjB [Sutcliffiella halmapala]|uniref:sporulation protein YpjB n=1 Tax=Sutcliffiella halmapala TaxID=79882 RepID=UPI000994B771|nr:sporulation protein YpjB [Sutcliffiella halmapala]
MNGKRIIVLLLFLLLIIPTSFDAHSHTEVQPLKLNILTDDALQLVKNERYVEAHNLLDIFSDEFTKVMMEERTMTMDQIRIITIVHDQSMAAMADLTLPHEEKVRAITRLRLVVDAMTSEHQPLWTEMEGSIMATFNQLKDSVEIRDSSSYQQLYQRLLLNYNLIHPSLRMDVKPEYIQKVDAHIDYLYEYRNELLSSSQSAEELQVIEADLKALFTELKEDETDPSLIWVMISTGSIIFLTLFYVGWRKYQADKKRAKRKKQKD